MRFFWPNYIFGVELFLDLIVSKMIRKRHFSLITLKRMSILNNLEFSLNHSTHDTILNDYSEKNECVKLILELNKQMERIDHITIVLLLWIFLMDIFFSIKLNNKSKKQTTKSLIDLSEFFLYIFPLIEFSVWLLISSCCFFCIRIQFNSMHGISFGLIFKYELEIRHSTQHTLT